VGVRRTLPHFCGLLQLAAPQNLRSSHSALAFGNSTSCTVCYYIDTENLTYSILNSLGYCWITGTGMFIHRPITARARPVRYYSNAVLSLYAPHRMACGEYNPPKIPLASLAVIFVSPLLKLWRRPWPVVAYTCYLQIPLTIAALTGTFSTEGLS